MSNAKVQQQFRAEQETAPVIAEGDVSAPLRKVRDQYIARAQRLQDLGVRPAADGMYYEHAAQNVGALIPNRYAEALVEEALTAYLNA